MSTGYPLGGQGLWLGPAEPLEDIPASSQGRACGGVWCQEVLLLQAVISIEEAH